MQHNITAEGTSLPTHIDRAFSVIVRCYNPLPFLCAPLFDSHYEWLKMETGTDRDNVVGVTSEMSSAAVGVSKSNKHGMVKKSSR